jgi:hypothetical protein
MTTKACLRAMAVAVLMVTASIAVLTGEVRAEASAAPHAVLCNAPTASITSITSKEYVATLKGNASVGSGVPACIMTVEVTWGDGLVSFETTFPFTSVHTYYYTGTFTVKVNASQNDGQYAVAASSVVIHGTPYTVYPTFDKTYHLPGDASRLFVKVANTTTGAPQIGLQSFFITSCYISTNSLTTPCTPVSTLAQYSHLSNPMNLSSYPFTVPPDADPGTMLSVTVEANETFDGQQISVNGSAELSMASPARPDLCVGSTVSVAMGVCAPGVGSFLPGQDFIVTVTTLVNTSLGTGAVWPNATVAMAFYLNGNPVHPKNLPALVSLLTNSLGVASTVVDTTSLGTGYLNISVGITDSNNPSLTSKSRWMFVTLEPTPAVQVQVTLGAGEYYGGDTLQASYAISTLSGTHANGWFANSYVIVGIAPGSACNVNNVGNSNAYQVLVSATVNPGASGNIPSYPIPTGFQGTVDVAVFANNATATAYGQNCALVTPATILIQPSEVDYNPGDNIQVGLTPEGSILSGATYYAEVTGSSNGGTAVIFNQSLGTSTSFNFNIPSAGTLSSYTLTVVALTTTGLIVAGQDVTLEEHSGYAIEVSVKTASMYSDGSFQPGQSVSFGYTITSLGTSQSPTIFTLEAYFQNSAQVITVVNEQSASGTLSMSLPSSLGTGVALVEFEAVIPTPTGTSSAITQVGILVNPSPSFLDYKPFGSSFGMTMGQIILIVILVVLALLVFIMWRRRDGGTSVPKPRRRLFHRKEGMGQWNQAPPEQQPAQPPAGYYAPPAEGGQAPPAAPPPADNSWSPPPMPPAQETTVDYPAPPQS